MAWTTAINDLRSLISDGSTDRYCYRKKCFGNVDGTNNSFKTFEFRRIIDFTNSSQNIAPLGVYVDSVRVTPSNVSSDSVATGEFTLATAPTAGQVVEASYYYQWFLDSELSTFLTEASEFLGFAGDYTQIAPGLQPAAKYYAAGESYHKMATRWSTRASEMYLVEDAPNQKNMGVAATYLKLANDCKEQSRKLREDYYTRNSQASAPLYSNSFGSVPAVTPQR